MARTDVYDSTIIRGLRTQVQTQQETYLQKQALYTDDDVGIAALFRVKT
jgi:hypothetical protein